MLYFAALVTGRHAPVFSPPTAAAFVVGALLASLSWQLLIASLGAALHVENDAMLGTSQHLVVIGVDDSPAADAALRWALNVAATRHAAIRLVTRYRPQLTFG